MFSAGLKTCLDVALCEHPNLASWVQLGCRSPAGFPVWLLEQLILFVRNEFLILNESICRGQSQEKQLKRAHLPFLTPHRCSPKEHVGRGRSLQPVPNLLSSPKGNGTSCALAAGRTGGAAHTAPLSAMRSTYGASGEQGEAEGNPALIDKAGTSRRRCWIRAPLVSFEGEEFLQASWGPWGAAISNVDIIPLCCSGSSVL